MLGSNRRSCRGPVGNKSRRTSASAGRDVASAPNRWAFDDSSEGERLRNYESSCNRALTHTIDTLFKVCKASIAGKLVPAAAAVESSIDSMAPSDQRIAQTEPNSVSINHTETESVATVDQGIRQTEPNSVSIDHTETDAMATVDQGIRQTEPNSVSIDHTETDAMATSIRESAKPNPIPCPSITRSPSRWHNHHSSGAGRICA